MKTLIKTLVISSPIVLLLLCKETNSIELASQITAIIYAITFTLCKVIFGKFLAKEAY